MKLDQTTEYSNQLYIKIAHVTLCYENISYIIKISIYKPLNAWIACWSIKLTASNTG